MNILGKQWLLFWFCLLQFFNFVERGAVASSAVKGSPPTECTKDHCQDPSSPECQSCDAGIQGEFKLSNAHMGLLASLFTAGLTIASPVSAHLVKLYHPFTLIGAGQLIFTVALVGAGLSPNFPVLLVCRTVIGMSEPSLIVVAPALIDLIAPKERRSLWLGLFYMCISLGTGAGLAFGFLLHGHDWRWSFRIQAAVNFPLALLFLCSGRPEEYCWAQLKSAEPESCAILEMRQDDEEEAPKESPVTSILRASSRASMVSFATDYEHGSSGWPSDVCELLTNTKYVLLLIGFTIAQAVAGVIIFWGPKAGETAFSLDEKADIIFSAIVVATGIGGTVSGGWLLDRLGGGLQNACLASAVQLTIHGSLAVASFWVTPRDPKTAAFLCLFSVSYFVLSSWYAPAVSSLLWACRTGLRAQAIGFATFVFHVLGDIPSPYYAGAIQDRVEDWRLTFTTILPFMLLAACFFFAAYLVH